MLIAWTTDADDPLHSFQPAIPYQELVYLHDEVEIYGRIPRIRTHEWPMSWERRVNDFWAGIIGVAGLLKGDA